MLGVQAFLLANSLSDLQPQSFGIKFICGWMVALGLLGLDAHKARSKGFPNTYGNPCIILNAICTLVVCELNLPASEFGER